jgi:hypothetical protein
MARAGAPFIAKWEEGVAQDVNALLDTRCPLNSTNRFDHAVARDRHTY